MNDKKNLQDEELHADATKEATSFGGSEPTDGRSQFEWESRYPNEAQKVIRLEALGLVFLFFISLSMLLLTWCGALDGLLSFCCQKTSGDTLKWYSYITFSGLLAGVIFSMKYLYHAVARGTWHIDRQLWRFMSPLMSLGVAFIVGALVHANMLNGSPTSLSSPTAVSIGFVAGYFSDSAIAKMYEIANVLFGTSSKATK